MEKIGASLEIGGYGGTKQVVNLNYHGGAMGFENTLGNPKFILASRRVIEEKGGYDFFGMEYVGPQYDFWGVFESAAVKPFENLQLLLVLYHGRYGIPLEIKP
jgi:hypothetical protein